MKDNVFYSYEELMQEISEEPIDKELEYIELTNKLEEILQALPHYRKPYVPRTKNYP